MSKPHERQMCYRVSTQEAAELEELRAWFQQHWDTFDSFVGGHPGLIVPPPIVAEVQQPNRANELVGALAFSTFARPAKSQPSKNSTDAAVWVNAVLVAPAYRGCGIASQFIGLAVTTASELNIQELFVLSEYPQLYQQLGWQRLPSDSEPEAESVVLTKSW